MSTESTPAARPLVAPPRRHPSSEGWLFPPPGRPPLGGGIQRANLRELAARPGRFEHHLTVVAAAGAGRLELATASEPLYFAHENISDEYAVSLPTGHPLLDAMPLRTFLSHPETGEDVARLAHRVGDLVLHPLGRAHWPGRLRPPFAPLLFPEGMRRAGLSLVFCAAEPEPVHPGRPLGVSAGREEAVRGVVGDVPVLLRALLDEPASQLLAQVGDATLELLVRPAPMTAPTGGYLLVLVAEDAGAHFATDLLWVPPGGVVPVEGVERALWFSAAADASPPPPSWGAVPGAPGAAAAAFTPAEDAPRGALPFRSCGIVVRAVDDDIVEVVVAEGGDGEAAAREVDGARAADGPGRSAGDAPAGPGAPEAADRGAARLPRYWLARFLYRVALHGYRVGRIETYGGFWFDDRDGPALGVRGGGSVRVEVAALPGLIEGLYRAVAPPGYRERL